MNTIQLRMKALLDIAPSMTKTDDQTAVMKLNSGWDLKVTILEKSIIYEARSKGKTYNPKKDLGVPDDIKGAIEAVEEKLTAALLALLDEMTVYSEDGKKEEPAKDPVDNLKAGGFTFDQEAETPKAPEGVPPVVDSNQKETPIKDENQEVKEAIKNKIKELEEEKAQREKEENIKRLEELERFEQERAQAEATKKKPEHVQNVNSSVKEDVMYSQPEDKLETAPKPRKGEVGLLDILCDLVDDDLIQIFGKTGTCKTSIAIQAGLEARRAGKSVYYLDTEKNISKKKKAEMLQAGVTYCPYTPSNHNKIFESVRDIEAFHNHVKKIPKVDLLIVDSLGLPCLSVYCAGNQREQGLTLQKMMLISNTLKSYANRNGSLVIVINQPESDMNKDPNTERRSFGDKVEFFYKELLKTAFVSKSPDKTIVVAKTYRSRDYGQGTKLFTVEITDNGVKVIQ